MPGTYARLALDNNGRYGPKPSAAAGQINQASRYIAQFQSRRSLLIWRIFGQRLDGFSNDDFPAEAVPGDPNRLQLRGKPVPNTPQNRARASLAYTGGIMPPPDALTGAYVGPNGEKTKVAPLSDKDRRTLIRWIDLGCAMECCWPGAWWSMVCRSSRSTSGTLALL